MSEYTMTRERIHWIDVARGFFIIAIVIGHTFSNPVSNIRWFVFAFHVPAWFFLSGLCFTSVEHIQTRSFIKKKIKTILIPYVLMSLLSIAAFFLVGKVIPRVNMIVESPLENIRALLYSNSNKYSMKYNLPLWFLPCLLILEILGYFSEKVGKSPKMKIAARMSVIVVSIIVTVSPKFYLPWHMETALAMMFWFELGILTRDYFPRFRQDSIINRKYILGVMMLILIGGGITFVNIHNVAVRRDAYGVLWNYYLSTELLILGFCLLAKIIRKNMVLEYIGKNSLGILLFHKFPILVFQELIPFTKQHMDVSDTPMSVTVGFIIVIISLVISVLAIKVCKKIFPLLIGYEWRNESGSQGANMFSKIVHHISMQYKNQEKNAETKLLPGLCEQRENCCSCSACFAICPVHAISMEPDNEGFLYPEVDVEICIRCYRCISVCAFKKDQEKRLLYATERR